MHNRELSTNMGSLYTTLLQSMVIACLRSELALQFVFSSELALQIDGMRLNIVKYRPKPMYLIQDFPSDRCESMVFV